MITLYHGSNVQIEAIDLTKSKKGKDFGCGFYLNADKLQAESMALRTAERMQEGLPIVTAFEFEELKFRGNRAVQYFFGTPKAIRLLSKVVEL